MGNLAVSDGEIMWNVIASRSFPAASLYKPSESDYHVDSVFASPT